ncbi:MAG: hypothetical protein AAGU21_18795 [Solidesulfovibrio sp.]|uniref:hypothetical protein n=1 Tax=Solidesulfovibrio sp. TaxID=2910990 RepID=UPI003158B00A
MDNAIEHATPYQVTAEELVKDLDTLLETVRGIACRLEFIGTGLALDNPNIKGASLALVDTEMKVLDLVEDLERMAASASELAGATAETDGGDVRS